MAKFLSAFAQKAIEQVKREDPQFNLNIANENDYEKYLPFISNIYKPYWYAAIYNYSITQKAKELLTKTSHTFEKLGILMNSHQKILQECIQNTPSQMVQQIEWVRKIIGQPLSESNSRYSILHILYS